MIAVVNEPHAEVNTSGWLPAEIGNHSFEEFVCRIENDSVFICPSNVRWCMIFPDKSKRMLSMLRGKITKQSEQEIEDQISDLRNEWDRNI
jgi:hypothetical protein